MRLPESKIKEAILHPEEEVRLSALTYFAASFTTDESVMPLVIEAIEKYGRDSAFRILRAAERLPQSESSFNWLLNELQAEFDPSKVDQDNFRFAVCLALLSAPLELLVDHQNIILNSPNFAPELVPALNELVTMASWDWDTGWKAFNAFIREIQRREFTNNDAIRHARLVRVLGRLNDGADQILNLLKGIYRGTDRSLMQWADSSIVELAGEMRLKEAIPLIIDRMYEGNETVLDECGPVLAKIGGNEVVEAVSECWANGNEDIRFICTEALDDIHTDLSAETCLELLKNEDDLDLRLHLGQAVLSHFTLSHIDIIREMLTGNDDELIPDQWDLRHRLIATATITGERFPEYAEWHQDAVSTKYGWGHIDRTRIADNFRLDEPEPEVEADDDYFEPRAKKISRNDPCPCGSGKKFKKCCIDKDFEWLEDEDGNIFKSIPMSDDMVDMLQSQREAFVKTHGREPGPDDPVFPDMPHPEHLEHEMVQAMKLANIDPAKIYAFEKTGRLVTEENQNVLTEADLAEWEAAIDEYEERFGV